MMKAVIIQFPFGVVAFDEHGNLADKVLFSKKPLAAAKSIMKIESGKISEVASLLTTLQKRGYDAFVFENAGIANDAQRKLGVSVEVAKASEVEALRGRMEQVAVETGFVKDAEELAAWNRNVSMELAKLRVKGAAEKRDLIIAQAIQTLDDLDRIVNAIM